MQRPMRANGNGHRRWQRTKASVAGAQPKKQAACSSFSEASSPQVMTAGKAAMFTGGASLRRRRVDLLLIAWGSVVSSLPKVGTSVPVAVSLIIGDLPSAWVMVSALWRVIEYEPTTNREVFLQQVNIN